MLEPAYRNAILLTWDREAAAGGHWELGPFPSGNGLGTIAGWTVASEEGGIPPAVARMFARAMTRFGRVTFPCSTVKALSTDKKDEAGWRRVRAEGDDGAFLAQERVPLLSTLQEQTVAQLLFEDPYYQWWNASQFALVSRPADKLSAQPSRFARELFEEGWAAAAHAGAFDVVMRSGVDGDVCGLAFATMEVRREFEALLEEAAAENGLQVRTVSHADFAELLSQALGGPDS